MRLENLGCGGRSQDRTADFHRVKVLQDQTQDPDNIGDFKDQGCIEPGADSEGPRAGGLARGPGGTGSSRQAPGPLGGRGRTVLVALPILLFAAACASLPPGAEPWPALDGCSVAARHGSGIAWPCDARCSGNDAESCLGAGFEVAP
jgi:hypothetical protein